MIAAVALLLGTAIAAGCDVSAATSGRPSTRSADRPSVLAAEVEHAQAVVDDASAAAARVEKAARAEQLAFRKLADRPRLRRATLARVSTPAARSAASAALRAADALARIVPPARRFPHWRILSPPSPKVLRSYFEQAGARYGIAWQYLAAIELVETRMGRIRGSRPAGARGPMQFMPATWAEYGRGSIDNQRDSITAAARFLAANGGRTSIGAALLHYNHSHEYVVAVESYAREMRGDARAFYGYYYWQVIYQTTRGSFLLPLHYPHVRPRRLGG